MLTILLLAMLTMIISMVLITIVRVWQVAWWILTSIGFGLVGLVLLLLLI